MMKKRYYKKVWEMIGFVVNISQMIEYNLANILALNEILVAFDKEDSMYELEYVELLRKTDDWYKKLDRFELGKLLENIESRTDFTKECIDFLTDIRTERNFFVHNIFKDDLFTKAFQDNPKQYIPRLQELIAKMHAANDELVKIFAEMKKEVKMIY